MNLSTIKLTAATLLFCVSFLAAGCSKLPRVKITSKGGANVTTIGETKTAPQTETEESQVYIPIPSDTKLTVFPDGKTEMILKRETALNIKTVSESIKGAESFAPPSPAEKAKGEAVKWFYIASAVLVVTGAVFGYFQHWKAAGFAFAGSILVPVIGNFVSSEKAVIALVGFGCVSLTMFAAWYLVTKKWDLFPKNKNRA